MNQKCNDCGSEWNSSNESKKCPFCGASLKKEIFTNASDVLTCIFENHGYEVLCSQNMLNAYFGDYAPNLYKERKILKIYAEANFFNVIYGLLNKNNEERFVATKKIINELNKEYFMDYNVAQTSINWFAKALKWDLSFIEDSNKIEIDTNEISKKDTSNNQIDAKEETMISDDFISFFIDGDEWDRNGLGKKGSSLCRLTQKGLPVPHGFIINVSQFNDYYENYTLSNNLKNALREEIVTLEGLCGQKFGSTDDPLLLSIRCSPRVAIPGLMPAILNVGLNDETVIALGKNNNPMWALELYFNFILTFSCEIFDFTKKYFINLINQYTTAKVEDNISEAVMKLLCEQAKDVFLKTVGEPFPQDVYEQLYLSIKSAYKSWENPRANVYRRNNDIPFNWGMGVIVQKMVFGNWDNSSGVGKCVITSENDKVKNLFNQKSLVFGTNECLQKETDMNYLLGYICRECEKNIGIQKYVIEITYVKEKNEEYIVSYKLS